MNVDKFINIPFKNKGRDFDGVDCIGLVRLILLEFNKVKIPKFENINYSCDWYTKNNYLEDNYYKFFEEEWVKVKKPYKPFDVIFFKDKTVINHVGIFIGDNKFLHVNRKFNSRINNLEGYWESKKAFVVRYKDDS